jgi:hypothetical protein
MLANPLIPNAETTHRSGSALSPLKPRAVMWFNIGP